MTLLSMSWAVGEDAGVTWPALSGLLGTWAWIGLAVIAGLALALGRVDIDRAEAGA